MNATTHAGGSAPITGTGLDGLAGAGTRPAAAAGIARAFDPAEILRIIIGRKRLILALALLGPLVGLGISLMMTPRYEAVVQLKIDKEDPVVIPGGESSRPLVLNGSEYLATQIGLLRSRSLAQRVASDQRLANNPRYADQTGNAAQRADAATSKLHGQVTVELVRDSRLVNITVADSDAAEAAALSNSFANQFIASNLDREYDATAFNRRFLEDRINTTRDKLEKSERDIVAYATQQGIIEIGGSGPDGGGKTSLEAANLAAINTSLAEARALRISAEQRYRQSRRNGATTESVANPVLQDLTGRRAEAMAEYQEKSAIFLPSLPAQIALRQRIASLDQAIARERGNLGTATRSEYEGAVARERELQTRLDATKTQVLDLRRRSIQYTILQREVDTNRVLYDGLLQKYKEVGVSSGIGNNKVSIVDRARAPGVPSSPNILWNVLLGLLAGIGLGLGGAFLLEFIDDTIKSPDDVGTKLDMTLLGVMPSADEEVEFVDQVKDPKSDLVESAHSLRTALQFATSHGVPRSLLITSSRPGEGKSSVSLALATSLARLGRKVLLIDADMRKPTYYHGSDSRSDTMGLSNLLSGEIELAAATHKTDFDNLAVVMAGPGVPNPGSLLAEGGFATLLAEALERYDHVVVDGPPVMGLADAPIMASMTEAVLMVVEAASVFRSTVLTARARLTASNGRVLGVVLNKLESRRNGYGYGYSYSYNYGDGKTSEGNEDGRKIVIVK